MTGRNLLAALSVKYHGDFEKILNAIKVKENFTEEEVESYMSKITSKFITILDSEYPESLKKVYKPPLVLFYYGDLSLLNSKNNLVAVIGSRDMSEYGKKVTKTLTSALARNNRIIISGLAKGVDVTAHQACIDNNGKTIAILGSGIDVPYPDQNKKVYEKIKSEHLVMSEYPNNTEPSKEFFPMRNRIVAGLADKILVTEAYQNSGTCITVMYGLTLGKDILSVPTEIFKGSMTNKIIQDGGFLVESEEDVLFLTERKN